ncbi:MAG: reverse transcriptase domain-containing protein [Campylobacterota bacterium]|nr:reverse transcriptase domain-containing protein [Campylobacterota bacterium]
MYDKICDINNLYKASKDAMKGKKSKKYVAKFWLNEDKEINSIHKQLLNKSYRFGTYKEFTINDNGVQRKISAAPFKDRVVHHAITNILEPIFEPSFIYDSYANRKGKGTLKALQRAKYYANKYKYVLQLDIKKYFPSIDFEILLNQLEKKVTCKDTLSLLEQLIYNSNKQDETNFYFEDDNLFTPYEKRRGLPLGNQTSQFFGNIYLNSFDHTVKERFKIKGYIRYVDDMTFFSDSKKFLQNSIKIIQKELNIFRLKLHPLKIKLNFTKDGFVFLGHKVFSTHFRLTNKAIRRGRKKLIKTKYLYKYDKIDTSEAKNKIFGVMGFFSLGKNYQLTKELLFQTPLKRGI